MDETSNRSPGDVVSFRNIPIQLSDRDSQRNVVSSPVSVAFKCNNEIGFSFVV